MPKNPLSFFLLVFLILFVTVTPVKSDDISPTLFWSSTTDYGFPTYSPEQKIITMQREDGIHVFWVSGNVLYERLPSGTIATRFTSDGPLYSIAYNSEYIVIVGMKGITKYNIFTSQVSAVYITTDFGINANYKVNILLKGNYIILSFVYISSTYRLCIFNINTGSMDAYQDITYSGSLQNNYIFYIYNSTDGSVLGYGSVLFTTTNTYMIVIKNDLSKVTYTSATGVTINNQYPTRLIRSDLTFNPSCGAYSGAVTIMCAPIDSGACRIVNIFFSGGASFTVQTVDIPNPEGAVGNGMGAVWCYHTSDNQYGISFYKSLYSDRYKYTITLSYNTQYQITSASASQVSDANYPILLNPNWIFETYLITANTSNTDYFKEMYGWSDYICGSIRVEWTTYPSNQLNMYTLNRILATGGEGGGGGTGQSGSVTGYQTITNSTYYYFKLTFPSTSDVKIMSLGVDLNVTGVNATYPLTLKWLIFNGDTLKYTYHSNITSSTTLRVTVNPEIMVGNGNIRLGFVPIVYAESSQVQLGYGVPNVVTYYKPYQENMSFIEEGYLWNYRGAFSYVYQDLGSGIGTGGISGAGQITTSNGSYTYQYNGSTPWSGQAISSPTTPVGNDIRNAFISWGYGDIGGIVVFLIMSFALMLAFARFGLGSEALIPAFGISSITTLYMGLLDITMFAIVILILIILAGYKVFMR